MNQIVDFLRIRRVANGWVVMPGIYNEVGEMTHVYRTAQDLADHVKSWALGQEAYNQTRRD